MFAELTVLPKMSKKASMVEDVVAVPDLCIRLITMHFNCMIVKVHLSRLVIVHLNRTITIKVHPKQLLMVHVSHTITVKAHCSHIAGRPCSPAYYILTQDSSTLSFPYFGEPFMIRVSTKGILTLLVPFASFSS